MTLDLTTLGAQVRARRESRRLAQRTAASEIGISTATLSRLESGTHHPDAANLLKIIDWLGGLDASPEPHPPGADTMEAVELHLRADPRLTAAQADVLVGIVRVAYEHFRRLG